MAKPWSLVAEENDLENDEVEKIKMWKMLIWISPSPVDQYSNHLKSLHKSSKISLSLGKIKLFQQSYSEMRYFFLISTRTIASKMTILFTLVELLKLNGNSVLEVLALLHIIWLRRMLGLMIEWCRLLVVPNKWNISWSDQRLF